MALILSGKVNSAAFQKAKAAVEGSTAASVATIKSLLPVDYEAELVTLKKELGGKLWQHTGDVLALTSGGIYVGDDAALLVWLTRSGYKDHIDAVGSDGKAESWEAVAEAAFAATLAATGRAHCFLDVSLDMELIGRFVFELHTELAPKTCENFVALCTGSKGTAPDGTKLHYAGSSLHRVKAGGWIQGGDIKSGDGDGGACALGSRLADESFAISHDSAGILGMANAGPHTATSQFYVTLGANRSLDGKFVAFGRLIDGSALLSFLAEMETSVDRPQGDLVVSHCGLFTPGSVAVKGSEYDEAAAATKMQALMRSRQARRELEEQKRAAAKIAAVKRGAKARQEKKAQAEAATKIASIQRGKRSRAAK